MANANDRDEKLRIHDERLARTMDPDKEEDKVGSAGVAPPLDTTTKAPCLASTGSFVHYMGPVSQIPETSPGLRFVKHYMPAIDALDRTSAEAMRFNEILAPGATFLTNVTGAVPVTRELLEVMLKHREGLLSKFSHEEVDVQIFDCLHQSGNRTVTVTTCSVSIFKADPKQEPIYVHEMMVLELMKSRIGRPWGGFIAFAVKTYLDSSLMGWKAKEVFGIGEDGIPTKGV